MSGAVAKSEYAFDAILQMQKCAQIIKAAKGSKDPEDRKHTRNWVERGRVGMHVGSDDIDWTPLARLEEMVQILNELTEYDVEIIIPDPPESQREWHERGFRPE